MKISMNKRFLPWLLALLMLLGSAAGILGYKKTAGLLLSQQTAERWQGDNELGFAQVSCFMPANGQLEESQIFDFRTELVKKLTEASFEVQADSNLIHDAWCGFGKVKISRGQRSGEVNAVAVGGDYFDFHPIRLVSGSYLEPDDLMEDRVLLDRECAWMLFGGEELSGLEIEINGQPFVVAGVIEREGDRFSKEAYTEGMGIYMSYAAYKKMNENVLVSCYELVMAEPVEGFVMGAVKDKFPIGAGEIVDNTYRYEPERLLGQLGTARSMRLGAAVYPYWENAARASEEACARWLLLALLMAVLPALLILVLAVKAFVFARGKLREDYIPTVQEKLSESWRVRARKRWEKKHPNMK